MKNLFLILLTLMIVSCEQPSEEEIAPDIFEKMATPYAGQRFNLENTEYCTFDPGQDAFFPYFLRIQVGQGNVREVIIQDDDRLRVRFNRNGRNARIRGTVTITNQVEPKLQKFVVDIRVRRLDQFQGITFLPLCIRDLQNSFVSNIVFGTLISVDGTETLTIDRADANEFYVGEEAAYLNDTYVRGIALKLTVNGSPTLGQAPMN